MIDWLLNLIEQGGYLGIAFLMIIENVFPPIPSELIMGLGGVAVSRGSMEFWPLLLVGTVGATIGNYFWFVIGDRFGDKRLQQIVDRWGRWLTLEWEDIERASRFFRQHGQWVVFFLRFSPFLRTIVSLPAGLAHMNRWKFLGFTFAGAAIWNAALIKTAHWLSEYLRGAQTGLGLIIIASFALALAAYLWRVATWKPRNN